MLNAAQLALNREEITTGTNSTRNRSADQLRGNGEPTATTKAARTSHGTALNTELVKEVVQHIHDAGDQQATSCHPNAMTSNMEASKEYAIPARRRSGVGLLHKVHLGHRLGTADLKETPPRNRIVFRCLSCWLLRKNNRQAKWVSKYNPNESKPLITHS